MTVDMTALEDISRTMSDTTLKMTDSSNVSTIKYQEGKYGLKLKSDIIKNRKLFTTIL